MKYLAVLEQEGGCDYSIGCGMATISLNANTFEDALLELANEVWGYTDEQTLSKATLYEVVRSETLCL